MTVGLRISLSRPHHRNDGVRGLYRRLGLSPDPARGVLNMYCSAETERLQAMRVNTEPTTSEKSRGVLGLG
jgi:hypothetical protein